MKTCKLKPPIGACIACFELEEVPRCLECAYSKTRYELLDIKTGTFNDYAIVIYKGEPLKVSLNRVYDIEENKENNDEISINIDSTEMVRTHSEWQKDG